MGKRKANHTISGMNAASAQGQGAGYNEEFANENLTAAERQNNKKRKRISNEKSQKVHFPFGIFSNVYNVVIPKPLQIDILVFLAQVKFLLALLLFDYDHFLHHVTIRYRHF